MTDLNLPVTRRSLLLGAAGMVGAGALLAACGSSADDGGDTAGSQSRDEAGSPATGQFVVNPRFPNTKVLAPGNVRLAFSISDEQANLLLEGPDTVTGAIIDQAGTVIAPVTAKRRGTGLSVPYWAATAPISAVGVYGLRLEGAIGDPSAFILVDPSEATIPVPSLALPAFDTPTTADARGVDPVCTRSEGACPFHDVTLTDALASGKQVVYMIGTPAHCQFATCGPGLEFLIDAATKYPDVTFVHAEVYSDPAGTSVAPAVGAIGLDYEPVIWITDTTGLVTQRIDIVWDADDLNELLAAALS